jgi:hypothetical protein
MAGFTSTKDNRRRIHMSRIQRMLAGRDWRLGGALLFALGAPTLASAQAYPNGTNITGVVSQTASFDGGAFDFTVTSTQNGTTSSLVFFIVDSAADMPIRIANIMSAAAEQKTVSIWTYGVTYSYGGQSGYRSEIEFVNY